MRSRLCLNLNSSSQVRHHHHQLKVVCTKTNRNTTFKSESITKKLPKLTTISGSICLPRRNYNNSNDNDIFQKQILVLQHFLHSSSASFSNFNTNDHSSSSPSPPKLLSLKDKVILNTIKSFLAFYDILTLPFYMIIQQPWKVLAKRNQPKTAFAKFGPRDCAGSREVLGFEDVLETSTGKTIRKFDLGEYKWKTYSEFEELANHLSAGFEMAGIQPKDKIAIFAETREEWLLTAVAAFKRNLAVVTIFNVLGNDGVIHAINETEVKLVITSEDLLERCTEVLPSTPLVKKLVYMGKKPEDSIDKSKFPDRIKIKSMARVISNGAKCLATKDNHDAPEPNDTAIIMYTSGSTGVPKGVVMSHWNIVTNLFAAIDMLTYGIGDIGPDDLYPSYLPVAHVMELMGEFFFLAQGGRLGFSSPLTLIDSSTGIKEGGKGDLSLLRPTALPSAPLVLERIVKAVKTKVQEKGPLASNLFQYFYDYKVHWVKRGYSTPLLDKIFFSKFSSTVGGRIRAVTVGGAPIAGHTQEFIRTVLCTPVCISYAMTESAGLGAFTRAHDISPGVVGGPIGGTTLLRLVDWPEGNYKTTDVPYPRGEVYIGGEAIALGGYYKRPEMEDFFEDEDGIRWIKTGDIAELHPDGGFNIIDRKKDLVKLSTGEYISLGKVESILKIHPMIENICIVADPFKSFAVGIVVPVQAQLMDLARELNKSQATTFEELCADSKMNQVILQRLREHGSLHKLEKYELPVKIHVSPDPWTPQSELVTAALKNQRINLSKAFKDEINYMYEDD